MKKLFKKMSSSNWKFVLILGGLILALGMICNRFDSAISGFAILISMVLFIWFLVAFNSREDSKNSSRSRNSRLARLLVSILTVTTTFVVSGSIGAGVGLTLKPYSAAELAQLKQSESQVSSEPTQTPKQDQVSVTEPKPLASDSSNEKDVVNACEVIRQNISLKLTALKQFSGQQEEAVTAEINQSDSKFTSWIWPSGGVYAIMNAGSATRGYVQDDLKYFFPETRSGILSYFSSVSKSEFLSKSSSDWAEKSKLIESVFYQFESSLLAGSNIEPKPRANVLDFYYLTYDNPPKYTYGKVLTDYLKTEKFDCDLADIQESVDELLNTGLEANAVDSEVMDIAIANFGCVLWGKGFVSELSNPVTKCANSDFNLADDQYTEGLGLSDRNPFLKPYPDKWLNDTAKFSWCWNLGLKLNSSETACIADQWQHVND